MPGSDSTKDNLLFTFIIEASGATTIEQAHGKDIADAIDKWSRSSKLEPGDPLIYDEPIPLEGIDSVWCISGIGLKGASYLAHVTETLENTQHVTCFTFVTEKDGGTIIEQVQSQDIEDAVLRWHQKSQAVPGPLSESSEPTLLEKAGSVWRTSGSDPAGTLYTSYIVATQTSSPVSTTKNLIQFPVAENPTNGLEILPGQGLGDVRFGMSINEVEKILGRGDECHFHDDETDRSIMLRYQGAALFFDQSNEFRLDSIEVDRKSRCLLFGKTPFSLTRREILELMGERFSAEEIGDIEENIDEALEEASLSLQGLQVTFYFDLAGDLQDVQWSVFMSPESEYIWP